MSEWIKNYVLNKNYYFINYEDLKEKIEIKCKEINSVCKKYHINSKTEVFDREAIITINNKEIDKIQWEIINEIIELTCKNKKIKILLNGMNTYTVNYKQTYKRKDTIDKAIDYALEKLLN